MSAVIITRRAGESFSAGDVVVEFLHVADKRVKIRIHAPLHIPIRRIDPKKNGDTK